MKKLLSVVGVGTAVLLALTACSAPEPAAPTPTEAPAVVADLDALIEAAKAEGSVRVYAQIPEPSMLAFAEAFNKEYGIKVDALRLGGNTLGSRFDSEVAAGTPTGEVLITTDLEFNGNAAKNGHVIPFGETGVADYLEGFPADAVFEDYDAPLVQVLETGFIYNTDSVKAKEIPETWADLQDDRWAGKYCAVDPSTSASVANYFWQLREDEGEKALKAFGENIGRWYPNIIALNEAVAVGECELGINSAKFFVVGAQANGAPVDFAISPTTVPPIVSASVATSAEHPNAAKLFLYFILSQDGNALLNTPEEGSFGPWDTALMPVFSVNTPEDYQLIRDQTPEILAAVGL